MIVCTVLIYQEILVWSRSGPCDIFPSRFIYGLANILEMMILLYLLIVLILLCLERTIATLFYATYEAWRHRIGLVMILVSTVYIVISSLSDLRKCGSYVFYYFLHNSTIHRLCCVCCWVSHFEVSAEFRSERQSTSCIHHQRGVPCTSILPCCPLAIQPLHDKTFTD
ncbi:hypothetical protein Y032_0285g1349 [Ancylostoma ceylanicum]|nr:hypothetical protein Y032_0285g1349 [Ancylostoma ceylanicum]